MEMVFRKIEYWIEGDANERRRLDQSSWDSHKIGIKFLKHAIFYGISFVIANLFLSYIIGIKQLYHIVTSPLNEHLGGFIILLIFSFVFYFVFSVMREQICLVVCPYGRLQSVLLDKDSIVVAYDNVRGEPRGKLNSSESLGDCIDCKLCVQVCPTGIDIRNGTQLECINCAACIDACDQVMTKIKKPTGLIRYASMNQIINKIGFRFTPRIIGYSIVFMLLAGSVLTGIVLRPDVEATVLRSPGMLYQKQEDGRITNLYNLNLVNKTFKDVPVSLKLKGIDGSLQVIGGDLKVPAKEMLDAVFIISVDAHQLKSNKNKINIEFYSDNEKLDDIKTTFIGPVIQEGNAIDSLKTTP
jgi:cytochrome c oxidase accessory protein FixG